MGGIDSHDRQNTPPSSQRGQPDYEAFWRQAKQAGNHELARRYADAAFNEVMGGNKERQNKCRNETTRLRKQMSSVDRQKAQTINRAYNHFNSNFRNYNNLVSSKNTPRPWRC